MKPVLIGRLAFWKNETARKRILLLKGSPHFLGLSLGVGITLGILPGTGAIIAGLLSPLLGLNLPLMVSGALLTNPLTVPLVYGASYWIGAHLLKIPPSVQNHWAQILLKTLAGNLVLALAMGLIGYSLLAGLLVVFRALRQWRRRNREMSK